MQDRLRLFIAVELPADWHTALAAEGRLLETAAPGFGRWVNPDRLHLTLAFLGPQPAALLPAMERALEAAAADTRGFSLRLGPLGCFGSPRSVRVIWAGLEDQPPGALGLLRDGVVRALEAEAIPFEPGPFSAHITLARARRDATRIQSEAMHRALTANPRSHRSQPAAFDCCEVTLIRSDLRSTGAIYTPLHRAQLRT